MGEFGEVVECTGGVLACACAVVVGLVVGGRGAGKEGEGEGGGGGIGRIGGSYVFISLAVAVVGILRVS